MANVSVIDITHIIVIKLRENGDACSIIKVLPDFDEQY